jgi:5-oxoprolinase (ATP-hydrolysing)
MQPILITTKGFKDLTPDNIELLDNHFIFCIYKKNELFETIIEVDESIERNGIVIKDLNEQVINNALRQIFKFNSEKSIYIAFINSRFNPLHEIIFENLLHTAGYNSIQVSYKIDDPSKLFISI